MVSPPIERVLVVGATGRVGGELVRLLAGDGVPTRALVRSAPPAGSLPSGVEIVIGDLGAKPTVHEAVRQTSHVFVSIRDSPEQPRLEGNLIDTAVRCRVKHFIKVSAYAAGLEPPSGYGRIHAAIERQLKQSPLHWTVLRPYMYMQNILELAGPIRAAGILPLPLGRGRVAMIDARDVGRAAWQILHAGGHGGQIYEMTGPAALDGRECARIMTRALGRRVRYLALPSRLAGMLMRYQGIDRWDIEMRTELFQMLRTNGEVNTTDTYRRVAGTEPRPFARFIADHREQLR